MRQLQIAGAQIDHFLDARARIEHGRQQNIVPPTSLTRSLDPGKNRFNLVLFEILDSALLAVFERHSQNALRPLELIRMARPDITEEGVNGGEPVGSQSRP
jgi:hypothetical protein